MVMRFDDIRHVSGAVISEWPYVKILSELGGQIPLPGFTGRMTAVAQVNDMIAAVELRVTVYERGSGEMAT